MPFFPGFIWPTEVLKNNENKENPNPTPTPAPVVKKLKKDKNDYDNDFEKYYLKRYGEEIKPYANKPSLSLSYMMFMSAFPKTIRQKAQIEWDSNNLV